MRRKNPWQWQENKLIGYGNEQAFNQLKTAFQLYFDLFAGGEKFLNIFLGNSKYISFPSMKIKYISFPAGKINIFFNAR